MAARRPGSARFDPYFKVQWYDPRSLSWRDIQKAHTSRKAAEAAFVAGKACRVMAVSEQGRRPV